MNEKGFHRCGIPEELDGHLGLARGEPDRRRLPLCCTLGPRAFLPLETVFSALFELFRSFPAFRQNQAALAYTSARTVRNGAK